MTKKNEHDKKKCLYELLRVERNATDSDIRKAYLMLARKVHPDKNPGKPHAHEDFQALNRAYDILKDPVRRKAYDRNGYIDEGAPMSFWEAYERYKSVELTPEDIVAFVSSYKKSEEEKNDVYDYFETSAGDMTRILSVIIGSENEDRERYVQIIEEGLSSGKLKKKYKAKFNKTKKEILSIEEIDGEGDSLASDDDDDDDEMHDDDDADGDSFIASEDEDDDGMEEGQQLESPPKDESSDEDIDEEEATSAKFSKGQAVEARWRKGSRYYPAIVEQVHADGTFKLTYTDDNKEEDHVKESFIRLPSSSKKKRKAQEPDLSDVPADLLAKMRANFANRQSAFDQFADKYSKKKR